MDAFESPQEARNRRLLDGVRDDRRGDPTVAEREAHAVAGPEGRR